MARQHLVFYHLGTAGGVEIFKWKFTVYCAFSAWLWFRRVYRHYLLYSLCFILCCRIVLFYVIQLLLYLFCLLIHFIESWIFLLLNSILQLLLYYHHHFLVWMGHWLQVTLDLSVIYTLNCINLYVLHQCVEWLIDNTGGLWCLYDCLSSQSIFFQCCVVCMLHSAERRRSMVIDATW